MGDFNAHHQLWGAPRSSSAGMTLGSAIDSFNCFVLNSVAPSPTYIPPPPRTPSVLDLAVVSTALSPLCVLEVGKDLRGSDHFPINLSISLKFDTILAFSHKIKIPDSCFKEFVYAMIYSADTICEEVSKIPDSDPLGQYDLFCGSILRVARAFSPTSNHRPSHSSSSGSSPSCARSHRTRPSAPWWSDECAEAVSRRRQAVRCFRREPSFDNYELYRSELRSCRKILRAAKRKSWHEFCESLGPFTPTGKVWKQIRRFKNRKLVTSHESSLPHGNCTELDPCISGIVDRICESSCSPDIPIDPLFSGSALTSWLADPFAWEELQSALGMSKVKSSPGIDALDYRVLRSLPDSLLQLLLDIVNRFFSSGTFPPAWRHSLVYLIPKPNNQGFRPIALTSCVLKLVERMLLFRLQWHLESQCKLPEFQFGFRRSRSCLDNLSNFITDVNGGFIQGRVTAALFVDIKSAFDNVQPQLLIKELQLLNLPSLVLLFISNLISVREVQFVLNGQLTNSLLSRKGTPQGSVLSPMLFNIYLRRIRSSIPSQVNILQFADDIVIYRSSSDHSSAVRSLQRALHSLSSYLSSLGLEISHSKTQFMVFNRRHQMNIDTHVVFQEHQIRPVEEVRFLGVLLDPRLSGDSHVNYLINKGKRIVQMLSALRGIWWGSHPQVLLKIYQAMLRGSVEYACLVFSLKSSALFSKLEKVQNSAIRSCVGLRCSTPINILHSESCEPPFKLRFEFLASKFLISSLSILDHPLIVKLEDMIYSANSSKSRNFLENNYPLFILYKQLRCYKPMMHTSILPEDFMLPYETMHVRPNICFADNHFKSTIEGQNPGFIQGYFNFYFRDLVNQATVIYTDGAKSVNCNFVGSACFSAAPRISLMYQLPGLSTIFTAEAWAIYNAILTAADLKCNKVLIVTDSRSVLEALQSPSPRQRNHLIPRIRHKIRELTKQSVDLRLLWIPSHRGIPGNEMADTLAKRAMIEGSCPRNFKLPQSDIHVMLRAKMETRFERYLDHWSRIKGVQYFRKIYCKLKKPWFANFKMARSFITPIIRLRSDHYNLNYSLFRKNLVDDPSCSCGSLMQDFNHVLFECPLTSRKGLALRKTVSELNQIDTYDITDVLSKPTQKLCRVLAAFCKACDFNI